MRGAKQQRNPTEGLLSCALMLCVVGCGSRDELPGGPCPQDQEPACARPRGCAMPELVDAVCTDDGWSCGAAAFVLPDKPSAQSEPCTPLLDSLEILDEAPVSISDGEECRWLLSQATTSEGQQIENVLLPLSSLPICATLPPVETLTSVVGVPSSASYVRGSNAIDAPSGETYLLERGWIFDDTAPFGVRGVGTGLALSGDGPIGALDDWTFSEMEDFGDAALATEAFAYVYGCPGPPDFLVEACYVARSPWSSVHESNAWQRWSSAGWGNGPAERVFDSGPHRGPVFEAPDGSGFVHLFVAGFGDRIEIQRAEAPEGPWTTPTTFVVCNLPLTDPDAFCAGPAVHLEMTDPRTPDVVHVSYSIGSLAPNASDLRKTQPASYSVHLVAAQL